MLKHFRLIKRRKIKFDNPVLIIYNPNSGTKKDFIPKISERLGKEKI